MLFLFRMREYKGGQHCKVYLKQLRCLVVPSLRFTGTDKAYGTCTTKPSQWIWIQDAIHKPRGKEQGMESSNSWLQLLLFSSLMDFFKYNWSPCETHDECYVSLLCVNCLLNRSFSWLRDALSFTLMVLKGERDSDWKIHVSIIFWPRRTPLYPFWSTFSRQSLSRSQLENDRRQYKEECVPA